MPAPHQQPPSPPPPPSAAVLALARGVLGFERLKQRRFELLAVSGPGAPRTRAQGRGSGEGTTPASLAELVSSIANFGLLQPILVEELSATDRVVVAGERRLRALRWGAAHLADNPHFRAVPAAVCPGPLSEEERRNWQLVENLAREDLQPGELGAALVFARCAVLSTKLLRAGVAVPPHVAALDDPVARFRALDEARTAAGLHHLGAAWPEVLARLGIQMREERAARVARAFATLPPELSAEMDAAKVALATRMDFLRLASAVGGRKAAADELWEAVKARGRQDLLARALRESLADAALGPAEAFAVAEEARAAANDARRAWARRHEEDAAATAVGGGGGEHGDDPPDDRDHGDDHDQEQHLGGPPDPSRGPALPAAATAAGGAPGGKGTASIPEAVHEEVVAEALRALRAVAAEVRAGKALARYDAGSLRLLVDEATGGGAGGEPAPKEWHRRADGRPAGSW